MQMAGDYIGVFQGIALDVARGWVTAKQPTSDKLLVELICDGYPVAFDRADIAMPELRGHRDDICVGYQIRVPKAAMMSGTSFWVRVANTTAVFHPEASRNAAEACRTARGAVRTNGTLLISGWVQPEGYQVTPPTVVVKKDGAEITRFAASDTIPAPQEGQVSALAKGFRHRLPLALADGCTHVLSVETDAGAPLTGSPITVAAWSQGPQDLIQTAQTALAPDSAAHDALTAFCAGLEKNTVLHPSAVGFEDYAAWSALFRPPAPKASKVPFTVFLYGAGDADASYAKSQLEETGFDVFCVTPAGLTAADWPKTGYVAFLRAGDWLAPNALGIIGTYLERHPVAYSDSDQRLEGHVRPWFKPDWDPFLFASQGYVMGLLAARADAYQPEDDTSRSIEEVAVSILSAAEGDVGHCAHVLYHQEQAEAHGDAPLDPHAFRAALSGFAPLQTQPYDMAPVPQAPWLNRLTWDATAEPGTVPKVSILIATRDRVDLLSRAVETLTAKTQYPNYEILIVDNNSAQPETATYLQHCQSKGIKVLPYPGLFNFSAINNMAATASEGTLLCLLNNDVEIIDPDWLTEMVHTLHLPGVGAVGAKLLWDNDIVQHGGVTLGIDGGAVHVGNSWARDDLGYAGANQVLRSTSAVTAACLLVRKCDYQAVGGLDEVMFPVTFNDVDLCLKLKTLGKSVLWTPHAALMHKESASRGRDQLPQKAARAYRELSNLRTKWGTQLLHDPFYNRNLNRDRAPYEGLALPPCPAPPERVCE